MSLGVSDGVTEVGAGAGAGTAGTGAGVGVEEAKLNPEKELVLSFVIVAGAASGSIANPVNGFVVGDVVGFEPNENAGVFSSTTLSTSPCSS